MKPDDSIGVYLETVERIATDVMEALRDGGDAAKFNSELISLVESSAYTRDPDMAAICVRQALSNPESTQAKIVLRALRACMFLDCLDAFVNYDKDPKDGHESKKPKTADLLAEAFGDPEDGESVRQGS